MSTLVYSFHPDVPASEYERLRPHYASAGAACFDVFAFEWLPSSNCRQRIARTGLIFDLPAGNCLEVYSRSGHGFRHGIRLANGVGIIDSDYTGELLVALVQDGQGLWPVLNGAIAQCRLGLASQISLAYGEVNKQTARGVKGFGSKDIGEI